LLALACNGHEAVARKIKSNLHFAILQLADADHNSIRCKHRVLLYPACRKLVIDARGGLIVCHLLASLFVGCCPFPYEDPTRCAKTAQAKNALDPQKMRRHGGGMKNTREIIDTLGRAAIAQKLGVALRRVDRARTDERIAASWYAGLCELAGQDLPRHLFTFKGMEADQ
jgi:hypothetical protein